MVGAAAARVPFGQTLGYFFPDRSRGRTQHLSAGQSQNLPPLVPGHGFGGVVEESDVAAAVEREDGEVQVVEHYLEALFTEVDPVDKFGQGKAVLQGHQMADQISVPVINGRRQPGDEVSVRFVVLQFDVENFGAQ